MATLTTDEIEKPDIEIPTGKCHWWSSRLHCFHMEKTDWSTRLQRRCCWCGRGEYSHLVVAGHGTHLRDVSNQTLIWTPWEKIYEGGGY